MDGDAARSKINDFRTALCPRQYHPCFLENSFKSRVFAYNVFFRRTCRRKNEDAAERREKHLIMFLQSINFCEFRWRISLNSIIFSDCFRFAKICLDKYHHTDNRHGSPQHYIAYMKKGHARIVSQSRSIEVNEGDIFYIPMGLGYQSYWYGEPEIVFHSYGFSFFPDCESESFLLQKLVCNEELKNKIVSLPMNQRKVSSFVLSELYGILAELIPTMQTEKAGKTEQQYREIRRFIYDHPESRASDIARNCGISESTLYSVCKSASGQTPLEIKQQILLDKARLLLTTTDKSVQEISDILGFSSTSYFRKALRKQCDMTPKEIRKSAAIV